MRRALLLAVLFCLVSLTARAQETGGQTHRLYLSAAAADIATTGYLFAVHPYAYEGNPMYGWVMNKDRIAAGQRANAGQVAAVLAMSAGVDLATAWAVDKWIAPKHPNVAKALYLVGMGVRGRQAVLNVSRSRR